MKRGLSMVHRGPKGMTAAWILQNEAFVAVERSQYNSYFIFIVMEKCLKRKYENMSQTFV